MLIIGTTGKISWKGGEILTRKGDWESMKESEQCSAERKGEKNRLQNMNCLVFAGFLKIPLFATGGNLELTSLEIGVSP